MAWQLLAGGHEIVDNPANGDEDPVVTDLGPGATAPVIPLQALELADFSALAEDLESCLVELCGEFVGVTGGDLFGSGFNAVSPNGL